MTKRIKIVSKTAPKIVDTSQKADKVMWSRERIAAALGGEWLCTGCASYSRIAIRTGRPKEVHHACEVEGCGCECKVGNNED